MNILGEKLVEDLEWNIEDGYTKTVMYLFVTLVIS